MIYLTVNGENAYLFEGGVTLENFILQIEIRFMTLLANAEENVAKKVLVSFRIHLQFPIIIPVLIYILSLNLDMSVIFWE